MRQLIALFFFSFGSVTCGAVFFQQSTTRALNDSAFVYLEKGQRPAARAWLKAALQQAGNAGSEGSEEFSRSYVLLGDIEEAEGRYAQAQQHYRKSLSCGAYSASSLIIASALRGLASTLIAMGETDSVLFYVGKSLRRDSSEKNKIINNITSGRYWQVQNNDDKALACFQNAYTQAKGLDDKKWMGIALTNAGRVYFNHDMQKAMEHFSRAVDLWDSTRHADLMAWNYARLANALMTLGRNSEADNCLKRAKKITDITGNLAVKSYGLTSMGILVSENDLKKGISYMEQSVRIRKSLGQRKQLQNDLFNLTESYIKVNRNDKAVATLREGLNIAHHFNDVVYLNYFYQQYALIDSINGHYKDAYVHFRKSVTYKDTVEDRRRKKEVALLSARYESEEKEERIKLLEKEQALVQAEASRNEWQRNSVLVVFFLVIIATLFFLHLYRQRWRAMATLHEQSEKLRKHEIASLMSSQHLTQAKSQLLGQRKERQRIARELHDSVGGTLAGLKLAMQEKRCTHEQTLVSIGKLYEEVRSISRNMMHSQRTVFVQSLRESMRALSQFAGIDIHVKCYPEEKIDNEEVDKQFHLFRIIQELVNNAIHHSGTRLVEIQLIRYDDSLHLEVEDKGRGFERDLPVQGIGLESVSQRVEELGGTMSIDSHPGRGTIVIINIPDSEEW